MWNPAQPLDVMPDCYRKLKKGGSAKIIQSLGADQFQGRYSHGYYVFDAGMHSEAGNVHA